jgi:hypothetical protein
MRTMLMVLMLTACDADQSAPADASSGRCEDLECVGIACEGTACECQTADGHYVGCQLGAPSDAAGAVGTAKASVCDPPK